MSKNDNYTTGNLLDYLYHQKYYKLMNKIIIVIKKSMYIVAMEQHLMEFFGNDYARNVIIFGVDNNSWFIDIDNTSC